MIYVGRTVIHRVRINRHGVAVSACGMRFALPSASLHSEGHFTEDYAEFLRETGPEVYLCCHCRDRVPPWKRRRRKTRKRRF